MSSKVIFFNLIKNFEKLIFFIFIKINKDCIASYFEIKIKKGRLINFYIYLIKNSDKRKKLKKIINL